MSNSAKPNPGKNSAIFLPRLPLELRKLLLPEDAILQYKLDESADPLCEDFSFGLGLLLTRLGLDYHLAWAAVRLVLKNDPTKLLEAFSQEESLVFLIALLLDAEKQGHICLPNKQIPELWKEKIYQGLEQKNPEGSYRRESFLASYADLHQLREEPPKELFVFQELNEEDTEHSNKIPFSLVHTPADFYLYTRSSRYLETQLLQDLRARLAYNQKPESLSLPGLEKLDSLQREALEQFRASRLFILSGGPGTGKTTLAKYMALAFQKDFQKSRGRKAQVRLCAPTGRAASRLAESFLQSIPGITKDDEAILQAAASGASTLHRLRRELQGPNFSQKAQADLLIIDESSMLDLRLFASILKLIKPECSLLLLGDHQQLPSVDSGAVLADLLKSSRHQPSYTKAFAVLRHSFRNNPKIKGFAEDVLSGKAQFDSLAPWKAEPYGSTEYEGVFRCDLSRIPEIYALEMAALLGLDLEKPRQSLQKLRSLGLSSWSGNDKLVSGLILLSALKKGALGTEKLNERIQKMLGFPDARYMPEGLPVMVLNNNDDIRVYNGDRGLIDQTQKGSAQLKIFSSENPRLVPLALVKEWEASFAMTIHKSQGSEFDTVFLVLDKEAGLSTELIYTAITRARKRVILASESQTWKAAILKHTQRESLINERLEDLC